MTCYAATFTPSGIYCCNSTESPYNCEATVSNPPKCMVSLIECSEQAGGGCCPSALECSPNGCIHVNNASIISSATSSSGSSEGFHTPATASNSLGIPITVTTTIFQAPAATETVVKEGEIAQIDVGAGSVSIMVNLWIPYTTALFICCLAVVMVRM